MHAEIRMHHRRALGGVIHDAAIHDVRGLEIVIKTRLGEVASRIEFDGRVARFGVVITPVNST